jgi:hypothetical protein
MPRSPLVDGNYRVSISTDAGHLAWSFAVNRAAPLLDLAAPVMPDTMVIAESSRLQPVSPLRLVDTRVGFGASRLAAGGVARISVADTGVVAVSATVAAINPDGAGFLTLFQCDAQRPEVSAVNYGPGEVVSNLAVIPVVDGEFCVYSLAATDLVIDITGFERPVGAWRSGLGFVAHAPIRILDTRHESRLAAGEVRPVTVLAGTDPVPGSAVGLNVTVVNPAGPGWVRVFPCGQPTEAASINFAASDVRASAVVSATDAVGAVCMEASVDTDVVLDRTGRFASGGAAYSALAPIRLLDTRSPYVALGPTRGVALTAGVPITLPIAGRRGVPANAKAVSVNVTVAGAAAPGYVTVYPCGLVPPTSNVNAVPWRPAVANAALVALSGNGELCVVASASTHVIVDLNGVWI